MTIQIHDVLPIQDYYYLLANGEQFAKHGTTKAHGVVVFTNLERAEQFRMTVGKNMEFEPCRVTAEEFLSEAERVGAFCVVQGEFVAVCPIKRVVEE